MRKAIYENVFKPVTHPLFQFNESVRRLEEEHLLLKESLMMLYGVAKAIGGDEDVVNWGGLLRDLRRKVAVFMEDLDAHWHWEETEMFPMINWYFGEDLELLAEMEQEHELAEQYVRAYLDEVELAANPIGREQAQTMAAYLLQGYLVLTNHFRKEEELIAALADRSNAFGF